MSKKSSKRKRDWFRPKSYPHIGLPITYSDRNWVSKYVKDKKKIAKHAFLPFIYRNVKKRKFRRSINENGTRSEDRVVGKKQRDIYYASHLDSQIYSYYSEVLKEKYEAKLIAHGIEDCVTAYRRIPVDPSDKNSRNKCNIDFAKEVFDFIKNSDEDSLIAIAFDIESFFDSLDHKRLKKEWYSLFNRKNLEKDYYNLFKSLTQFSYVHENQIFKEFKDEIIVESKLGKRSKKKVKRKKYLFDSNAIAFCEKSQFATRIRDKGLVKEKKIKNYFGDGEKKKRTKGIPQGTPLSSVLANIYMLAFDQTVYEAVNAVGGLYRRYSDDMVIVCKQKSANDLIEQVLHEIKQVKLNIQRKKTKRFKFEKDSGNYTCKEWMPDSKIWYPNTNFTYLGFEFDGERVLIKSDSIAKYYRKMKRSVRISAFFAKHGKNEDTQIYRRKLYKRFSHLGAGRRLIYKRSPNDSKKWIKSYKYDWGNFITYVMLAAEIMDEPAIKKQLKNHWEKLNDEIERLEPD